MRIEVGYGLEGTLTDVASSRIIRNVMTPRFKAGDYDQGIELGVAAIVAQLEGRGDVTSAANAVSPEADSGSAKMHFNEPNLAWPERILLGALHLRHHRPVHLRRHHDARRAAGFSTSF